MKIVNATDRPLDVAVLSEKGLEPLWTVSINSKGSATQELPLDKAPYIPEARFAASPALGYSWVLPAPHTVQKENATVTITEVYAGFIANAKTD